MLAITAIDLKIWLDLEVYSETFQTSKMERFAKIVNG